jgi:hypothetical protein
MNLLLDNEYRQNESGSIFENLPKEQRPQDRRQRVAVIYNAVPDVSRVPATQLVMTSPSAELSEGYTQAMYSGGPAQPLYSESEDASFQRYADFYSFINNLGGEN